MAMGIRKSFAPPSKRNRAAYLFTLQDTTRKLREIQRRTALQTGWPLDSAWSAVPLIAGLYHPQSPMFAMHRRNTCCKARPEIVYIIGMMTERLTYEIDIQR